MHLYPDITCSLLYIVRVVRMFFFISAFVYNMVHAVFIQNNHMVNNKYYGIASINFCV